VPFEKKMKVLVGKLKEQMEKESELNEEIMRELEKVGVNS
jgi:hypothetical protein